MKTILIICVLLASINLFSLSSILARELADHHQTDASNDKPGYRNNPAIKCNPRTTYGRCIGQTNPKPKCDPKDPHARCTGTSPSGKPKNPGSPVVKPGTGKTGSPNNPAVKPGTGKAPIKDPKGPINKCDPRSPTYKSCLPKQNPKAKCSRGGGYHKRYCPPHDP